MIYFESRRQVRQGQLSTRLAWSRAALAFALPVATLMGQAIYEYGSDVHLQFKPFAVWSVYADPPFEGGGSYHIRPLVLWTRIPAAIGLGVAFLSRPLRALLSAAMEARLAGVVCVARTGICRRSVCLLGRAADRSLYFRQFLLGANPGLLHRVSGVVSADRIAAMGSPPGVLLGSAPLARRFGSDLRGTRAHRSGRRREILMRRVNCRGSPR